MCIRRKWSRRLRLWRKRKTIELILGAYETGGTAGKVEQHETQE